jgi:hypothetical protein
MLRGSALRAEIEQNLNKILHWMKKIILLDFGMDLIDFSRGSATPFDSL